MKADAILMIDDDDDNDDDDGNLQITYMCATRVGIFFSTIYANADVLKYTVMCAHVNCFLLESKLRIRELRPSRQKCPTHGRCSLGDGSSSVVSAQ